MADTHVRRPGPVGVWLLASRPKTLPAAAAPVVIGAGLAALHDTFRPLPALAALLAYLESVQE